jgi:hypothetical protein
MMGTDITLIHKDSFAGEEQRIHVGESALDHIGLVSEARKASAYIIRPPSALVPLL